MAPINKQMCWNCVSRSSIVLSYFSFKIVKIQQEKKELGWAEKPQ